MRETDRVCFWVALLYDTLSVSFEYALHVPIGQSLEGALSRQSDNRGMSSSSLNDLKKIVACKPARCLER